MIVKLRDPGFAFLPVCHLDSEEDLRPQRTGSNIFFCRPNYLSHFSSSFLYNLMDKNMSACRLISTAQNLFLRQQLALERQKVRDGVLTYQDSDDGRHDHGETKGTPSCLPQHCDGKTINIVLM